MQRVITFRCTQSGERMGLLRKNTSMIPPECARVIFDDPGNYSRLDAK
jgi:hypothetical protein